MESKTKIPGVLDGIRVLDFTQVLSGPYCTRMLADMGAEVLKVEPPKGEGARYVPTLREGVSSSFLQYNGGKKSLCIDLKKKEAKKLIKELVRSCDLLVENFAVGTMKRLGLDFETMQRENPKLIMCSITGYGQTGPNKNRLGFAVTLQADVGVTDILRRSRLEDVPPAPHGISFADTIASYHAFGAISAALYYRERTGIGQYIDISMYDSLLFTIDNHAQHYLMTHEPPEPIFGSTPLQGKDGQYIAIGFGKHEMVGRLFKLMGREDLISDERFCSIGSTMQHRTEFTDIIIKWLNGFESTDEVEEILIKANIPASKVHTVVEALQSSQVESHSLIAEMEHPRIGMVRVLDSPIRFSKTSSRLRSLAPELGEHNEYVMTEILHLSSEEVASLYERGVLYQWLKTGRSLYPKIGPSNDAREAKG